MIDFYELSIHEKLNELLSIKEYFYLRDMIISSKEKIFLIDLQKKIENFYTLNLKEFEK
jgi:hypothetical protein